MTDVVMMTTELLTVPLALSEAIPYLTLGGGGWLAWRFVRAYERRAASAARLRALAERVRVLESALGRVEGSVALLAAGRRRDRFPASPPPRPPAP